MMFENLSVPDDVIHSHGSTLIANTETLPTDSQEARWQELCEENSSEVILPLSLEVLSDEELWKRYDKNRTDNDFQTELLRRLKPIIKHLSKKHSFYDEIEDIEQIGSMGLVEAIQRYDRASKVTFNTFAWPRILGAILDHNRKQPRAVIQVGRPTLQKLCELARMEDDFVEKYQRFPEDDAELQEHTNFSLDELNALRQVRDQITQVVSLDCEIDNRMNVNGLGAKYQISDPSAEVDFHNAELMDQREFIHSQLRVLPEQTQRVFENYFFHNQAVTEIAQKEHVSKSRIWKILNEAKAAIRARYELSVVYKQLVKLSR